MITEKLIGFDPLPDDLARAVADAAPALGPFTAVHFVEVADSTNDLALALAAAGRPEGTTVVADLQRRGRGRRGREWFSPAGAGLYLSTVVRPPVGEGHVARITLVAGIAAARAIVRVSALPIELKWPNDLVIGHRWRKLGGILTEGAVVNGQLTAVVIGIGINLRPTSYPPELSSRATSIETELGREVPRGDVLVAVLEELRSSLPLLVEPLGSAVVEAWTVFGRRGMGGERVGWVTSDGERHGVTRGLDDDGALVVECAGRVERIVAGEVTWESLSRD